MLLSLLVFLPACSGPGWGWLARERRGVDAMRSEAGPVGANLQRLEVENRFGSLRIQGGEELGWEWVLTCWGDTLSEAEALLDEVSLEVREEGGGELLSLALVIPETAPRGLRGIESNLILKVPTSTRVMARNRFGATSIEGTSGGLLARCGHGDLDVRDVRGELDLANEFGGLAAVRVDGGRIANRHGAVEVEDARGDLAVRGEFGSITARRVGGKLEARNAHGGVHAEAVQGSLDLSTSFARMSVEGAPVGAELRNRHGDIVARRLGGPVDVRTSFGSLDLSGSPVEVDCRNRHGGVSLSLASSPCRVTARTEFGDVEVECPGGVSTRVDVAVEFGSIRSDIHSDAVRRDRHSESLRSGELGAPIQLELATEHGSVRLHRR